MPGPKGVVTPRPMTGSETSASSQILSSGGDAWATSLSSDYGFTVPRRFLWLLDIVVQAVAVIAAYWVAPYIKQLGAPGGPLRLTWLEWLSLPDAAILAVYPALRDVLWVAVITVPATLLFVQMLGGYRPLLEQSRSRVVVSSLVAPVLALSLLAMLLIATRNQQTSRAFVFSLALLTGLGLLSYRTAIRAYKRRRLCAGHYRRNVVAIGMGPAIRWLSQHFSRHVPENLYRLSGYLTPSTAGQSAAGEPESPHIQLPYLGHVEALGSLLIHLPIHEVVVIESAGSGGWMLDVIEQCDYFRVPLRIVPEQLLHWQPKDLHIFRSTPLQLPEIVLTPRHLDSDALFVKRAFDLVVSALLLGFLAPVFLLIAAAIKFTTPRLPVFYPCRHVGYKGRHFTSYKFTTMQADADQRKADLMHLNEMTGPVFKMKNDPRVTPLGKWLRKFSLNELPELWSVLKGDMSLVGPRPALPYEVDRYELWHKRKLCVQPGITCLWQVRGRNRISNFDDWVRMDFEYIDKWSLWLDCRILARTVLAVLGGSGS